MTGQEVSLVEIINALIKRKKTIFIITLLSLIIGIIISLMIKPVYRVTGSMELGNYEGSNFTNVNYAIQVLKSPDTIQTAIEEANINIDRSIIGRIEVKAIAETNIISLTLEHHNSKEAALILDSLIETFNKLEQEDLQRYKNGLKNEIDYIKREIELSNMYLEYAKKALDKFLNNGQPVYLEQSLAITEMHNFMYRNEINIVSLHKRLIDLEKSYNSIKEITKLETPKVSNRAIKPDMEMNIAIAGVIGLVFGFFTAFFQEYLRIIARCDGSIDVGK